MAGLGRCGNLKRFLRLHALKPKLVVRDLVPSLWPALATLFGPRGACGGCWCMYWRLEKGERWEDLQGAPAKRRMKQLVVSGKARGAIAFAGEEPVGWIAYGPRQDFPRLEGLERSPATTRSSLVAALLLHQAGLAGSRRCVGAPAQFASLTAPAGSKDSRGLSGEPEVGAAIAARLCLDGHAFAFRGCGV